MKRRDVRLAARASNFLYKLIEVQPPTDETVPGHNSVMAVASIIQIWVCGVSDAAPQAAKFTLTPGWRPNPAGHGASGTFHSVPKTYAAIDGIDPLSRRHINRKAETE